MGLGYGSEYHLLRFMGRHRKDLDKAIKDELRIAGEIDWFDFKYNKSTKEYDREYIGIEFLKSESYYSKIKSEWDKFWPNKDNAMNWDAIGKVGDTWLLVEAKAHAGELKSSTNAGAESKEVIQNRFDELGRDKGIITSGWLKKYYQKANRLLFLYFLDSQKIKAKLVFIYFLNGYEKDNTNIKTKPEWEKVLVEQDKYLNIVSNKWVKENVFIVFIDTRGNNL